MCEANKEKKKRKKEILWCVEKIMDKWTPNGSDHGGIHLLFTIVARVI